MKTLFRSLTLIPLAGFFLSFGQECSTQNSSCSIPELVSFENRIAAAAKPGWTAFCPSELPLIKHYLTAQSHSYNHREQHIDNPNYPAETSQKSGESWQSGYLKLDEILNEEYAETVKISRQTGNLQSCNYSGSYSYLFTSNDRRRHHNPGDPEASDTLSRVEYIKTDSVISTDADKRHIRTVDTRGCSTCGITYSQTVNGVPVFSAQPANTTITEVTDSPTADISYFGSQITSCTETSRKRVIPATPGGPTGYTEETLADEYTDADLNRKVQDLMVANGWVAGTFRSAMRRWNLSHETLYLRGLNLDFQSEAMAGRSYRFEWTETTFGENGGVSSVKKCLQLAATGPSLTFAIQVDPPGVNGLTVVTDYRLCDPLMALASGADGGGCSSCGGVDGAGLAGPGVDVDKLVVRLGMGNADVGQAAGSLLFQITNPDSRLADSARLSASCSGNSLDVVVNASGAIQQVKSRQALATVDRISDSQFRVSFYPGFSGAKVGAAYPIGTATPEVIWDFTASNRSSGVYKTIQISEIRGINTKTSQFQYEDSTGGWIYSSPDNLIRKRIVSGLADASYDNSTPIRTAFDYDIAGGDVANLGIVAPPTKLPESSIARFIQKKVEFLDSKQNVVNRKITVYELIEGSNGPQEVRVAAELFGSTPNSQNRTYKYLKDGGSQVKQSLRVSAGGDWNVQTFGPRKRVLKSIRGVQNVPPLNEEVSSTTDLTSYAVTKYEYDSLDTTIDSVDSKGNPVVMRDFPRTETECLQGTVVSRVKRIVTPAGPKGGVASIQETRLVSADAALTDPQNLVTTTCFYTADDAVNGGLVGKISRMVHADGTGTSYRYFSDSTGRRVIVRSGWWDSAKTSINAGSETTTTYATDGRVLSVVTRNVAPGTSVDQKVIDSREYSDFDSFGRARRTTYLGGLYTLTSYQCCGIDSTTDREGAVTSYDYDALKRVKSTTTAGITTLSEYDAAGNLLRTKRQASNGAQMLLNGYGYDDSGRMNYSTNGLGVITRFDEFISQEYLVHTTTEAVGTPDETSRVERYFADGRLAETGGSAEFPKRYAYGLWSDGANLVRFEKTINLVIDPVSNAVSADEWVVTLKNFRGNGYKTVYADETPNDNSDNPNSTRFYDTAGRLARSVDPDGGTHLYSYPGYGVQIEAVDMNRDGVINLDKEDRIVQQVADYSTAGTAVYRRSMISEWGNGSSLPVLVSKTESNVDGTESIQTTTGLSTSATTKTLYAGNGIRSVTTTAPDKSTTIEVYRNGRLSTSERRDASGALVDSLKQEYDGFGRLFMSTDSRGAVTYTECDGADQVWRVTSHPPGNGQAPQVTTTYFDNLGRPKAVQQPDGTTVTTEFYPTGLTRRTSGARTYPRSYTYDSQGRQTGISTYRDFTGNWSNPGTPDTTTFKFYPSNGRLRYKVYADQSQVELKYNASGRLKTKTLARLVGTVKQETQYKYNEAGDLFRIEYNNNPVTAVQYGYDRNGCQNQVKVFRAANSSSVVPVYQTDRLFDLQHNQLSETYSGSHPLAGITVGTPTDTLMRRRELRVSWANPNPAPTALSVATDLAVATPGYDGASRIASVADAAGYKIDYRYLPNTGILSVARMWNKTTLVASNVFQRDMIGRVQEILSTDSHGMPLPGRTTYDYDSANQVTSSTMSDGQSRRFKYDTLGQLQTATTAWRDSVPVAGQQYEFRYDTAGNRKSAKVGGDAQGRNLRESVYVPNALNQYVSRTVPAQVEVQGRAPAATAVSVNGDATGVYRKGEYFRKELTVPNASGPVWQSVSAGSESGSVYVPPALEKYGTTDAPGYDADGNPLWDSRWMYQWDGETG